ncbi:hypothetical protein L226DRAFT_205728 [Lentinus tigrinus ALCF2SS1-7]|uniref:uncharacterized protein n=1 Tax=Lentinus tigrinus ALCF2SS1-7 TaxID=1328758 RepID=UPI001165DDEF|nr:hypothetical protein L226DRAFT_205728 [Lentinus tigrinus ALCF2SS1-7]
MCYLRQVCYVYESCGHVYPMPDQEVLASLLAFNCKYTKLRAFFVQIACDSPRCRFSPMHSKSCHGASCKQTCKQYRGHPQQYSPQIAGFCPGCAKSR